MYRYVGIPMYVLRNLLHTCVFLIMFYIINVVRRAISRSQSATVKCARGTRRKAHHPCEKTKKGEVWVPGLMTEDARPLIRPQQKQTTIPHAQLHRNSYVQHRNS